MTSALLNAATTVSTAIVISATLFVHEPSRGPRLHLDRQPLMPQDAKTIVASSALNPASEFRDELDQLLLVVLPALKKKFGIDPNIVWSDASAISSKAGIGITLSKKKLKEALSSITSDAGIGPGRDSSEMRQRTEDVLRFVLAHEFAHMRRFALDDSIRQNFGAPKPVSSQVIECEADLWAGAALVSIHMDAGMPVQESSPRLQQAFALAAQMGSAIWGDNALYPAPATRSLCVTRGVGAGLYQQFLWNYRALPSEASRQLIESYKKSDPRIDGFETNKWDWGRREAVAMVTMDSVAAFTGPQGPSNFEADFRRFATLLERGQDVVRKGPITPISGATCVVESTPGQAPAVVVCRYAAWASATIAHNWYANTVAFFRNAVTPMGWFETSVDPAKEVCFSNRAPTGVAMPGDFADAKACVSIDAASRTVTLRATSQAHE